jgi:hypothetical protein
MPFEWLGLARVVQPLWSLGDRVVGKGPNLNFEPGGDGVQLRVENQRGETIILESIRATPPILSFSNGHEIGDLARAIITQQGNGDEDALAVIEPGKSVTLTVITFDPFGKSDQGLVITVKLHWRAATRRAFSKRSASRKISVRDIRDLQRAAERNQPRITILR